MNQTLGRISSALLCAMVVYGALAYQLHATLFSQEFAFREIDRADPSRAAKSILLERMPADMPVILRDAIDETFVEQRPWIVAESRKAAVAIQDYLRGDASRIEIRIDPDPLRSTMHRKVEAAVRSGGAYEARRLSPEARDAFETGLHRDIELAFTDLGRLRFDSAELGPDWRVRLTGAQSRLRLFRPPLILVILALTALLATAVVVGEVRLAGVAVFAAGAVLLFAALFSGNIVGLVPVPNVSFLPGVVAAYLPTLSDRLAAPLAPIAVAALVVGAGLIVASFITLRREPGITVTRTKRARGLVVRR